MALFFPEWIPWWLQLAIVGIIIIFGFCFLLMPFSVLGLKSRLTYLDHQMEDIQSQLRVLLKRVPDARERLEFKLQPIRTGEGENVREELANKGSKQTNSASDYYAAVPCAKSRPTRFDPPVQAQAQESASPRYYDKTINHDLTTQYPVKEDYNERKSSSSGAEQRVIKPINKEEQLYDPPSKSDKEEKQNEPQLRRRAEPILRWPPR